MSFCRIIIFCIVICLLSCSCSIPQHREVQEVVAQADSLWHEGKMYGVDEGDSATLAQAYERLKEHSAFSRQKSEYAHACYHYGKLLRAKEDPVAAMQAFIDATRSGTKDYHILGRVYSNMGSICHLAGEFPLSYEMYEKSAKMFLRDKDTLSYCYLLNDMAFELAEQGKKEETMYILTRLREGCEDNNVLEKTLETQALLYMKCKQYDSALYCANTINSNSASINIAKAQAYFFLNNYDSALIYAKRTIDESKSLFNQDNAYYILIHCDSVNHNNKVYSLNANRADVEKAIEIRHGFLSQAVQLLRQDLNHKPDWRWLYASLVTIVVIGLIICIYVYCKRRQRALLSQQVDSLTQMNEIAEKQHEQIIQKQIRHREAMVSKLEQNCEMLANADDFPSNLNWNDYATMCRIINDNFGMLVMKLQSNYRLPERRVRLCILVLMKVSDSKELASLLFYSESGIRNFKNRVAKKLGTNSIELRNTLINIAIND